jgi:H+/Cl- antiporter ClcA
MVGGQFAPMFFLGSSFGALYYHLLYHIQSYLSNAIILSSSLSPALFLIVGGATMVACQFRAPLMATLFALEITNSLEPAPLLYLAVSAGLAISGRK